MNIRPKQSYHPFGVVDLYLHVLPEKLLLQIPRSTHHEWRHKTVNSLFGYEWYSEIQQFFDTLKEVAASKRLIQVNRALLRIIAIRYLHWQLTSIYHQIIRDGAARFHISTFYKYTGLLQLKRILPNHRRKNHSTGIRAAAPLQILHAHVTVFRTAPTTEEATAGRKHLRHSSIARRRGIWAQTI